MRQTVLLGIGGTGSRVVNNVLETLNKKGISVNDGTVACAVLDTNTADNTLLSDSGTGIKIVATSKDMKIDQYLSKYSYKNPKDWCPYTNSFGDQSMLSGASEMRVKSRLAFMDTIENGDIDDLEEVLEQVFRNRGANKETVRVVIVSSLSGGTGAGMFIQIALWLRKMFEEKDCPVSIRGIFLLPDIFVKTISTAKDNPRKPLYYYANAYACIRELNTLNKIIQKDYVPEKRIVIDNLFDSDNPGKSPVYDYAFFIDQTSAAKISFDTIGEYEELVAQFVYMQLYAPMTNEMESVEDNLYRSLEKSSEPTYGSCGTSKAIYPVETVAEYCAIRAAKDSLASGWGGIDAEIADMLEDEKAAERDGIVIEHKIDPRDMFVKLFDEKSSKTGKDVTKADKFFVSVRADAFNVIREKTDKGVVDTPECKVEAFMTALKEKIKRVVTENGECRKITSVGDGLPNHEDPESFGDNIVDTLKGIRDKELPIVKNVIKNFEENAENYASTLVRSVMTTDIEAVNSKDEGTVYGLFMKKDPDGKDRFVHPVVAKYLIYKLMAKLSEEKPAPESKKKLAIAGDTTVSFDNVKTKGKTETREDYWKQVGLFTSKAEIAHFIDCYKKYNQANKVLCSSFEEDLLSYHVYKSLMEKLEKLASNIEELFKWFPELVKKLDKELAENIKKTTPKDKATIFVNASEAQKEAKYQKIGMDVSESNSELNEDVIKTVYGKFCYGERPNAAANKQYANKSILASFHEQLLDTFKDAIKTKYKEFIYINIGDAIIEQSDIEYEGKLAKSKDDPYANDNDASTIFDSVDEQKKAQERHLEALKKCLDTLEATAAPFLKVKSDLFLAEALGDKAETIMKSNNGEVSNISLQTYLTFWGFNPKVVEKYPEIEKFTGSNRKTSASVGYAQNEIYCYRSAYGVKASAIDKFNETNGGQYYTKYSQVINDMLKNGSEAALIDTPHLDKTWHTFIPYISSEMQAQFEKNFYTTFWKAIAYGRISLNPHGKYQLVRRVTNTYGNESNKYETLIYNEREIAPTEITELIYALRSNPYFESELVPELQKEFEEDVRGVRQYSKTKFVSNLAAAGELNPVVMIVRYNLSLGSNENITNELINSLDAVIREVASNYDGNRSAASVEKAKYNLCYRIFTAAGRTKGVEETFQSWISAFKELKLDATAADITAGATEDKPE